MQVSKADTVTTTSQKKLWELRGNVHIQSQRAVKFDTELMFWDPMDKEVNILIKFIRIEQLTKTDWIRFESNQ